MKRILPWLLVLVTLVLVASSAEARVGGGQSFSGGGGGGGGGGGDVELILLLIELVIRYPQVGVPLLIIFLGFLGVRHFLEHYLGPKKHVMRTNAASVQSRTTARRTRGYQLLRDADTGFSVPVLLDFVVLLHRRSLQAVTTGEWNPLTAFVDQRARKQLALNHPGIQEISEVVVGGIQVKDIQRRGRYHRLHIDLTSTRLERTPGGERRVLVRESWTFRRLVNAISLAPEETLRMGCPSCGAALDTTVMGACPNCDTPISAGQLQWQATEVSVLGRTRVNPPEVSIWNGSDEPSVLYPTVQDPHLPAAMRALQARHPDFEAVAFGKRVKDIYLGVQQAWSDGRWQNTRPWVTDPMWQSLRFWMEEYTANGLRNQLTDVKLNRLVIVQVQVDAWYESITVRIWGEMKDSVVERTGTVVGGNDKITRNFSEYWTFLRASGTGGAIHDAHQCPSCGAPNDNIGQAGVCGYCDAKITSGRFDWVLSRIDQCEAYNGA
ncbi:MAG: TIM44-like domain-containing protein [Rhodobacterales bacterium]|nr:TIM44-like domain-containing protein [Rhodobacterales bacterium]